ncbi:sensor histidine kinase [Roseateles terrae]|uniref:Signal transduction histidine kinase/ligand-binding sensor domain-containing protein n=1 Tax=Roseateles terrae TaxID=431060 RepID=A0ABR6GLW2_9BURK|nr:sensor histidine kinase [Roseateles terrae]MBB3192657.1 signal transduction histidine kinase/ligand-binding sensor domain-containing protein [Roseateles terrae]
MQFRLPLPALRAPADLIDVPDARDASGAGPRPLRPVRGAALQALPPLPALHALHALLLTVAGALSGVGALAASGPPPAPSAPQSQQAPPQWPRDVALNIPRPPPRDMPLLPATGIQDYAFTPLAVNEGAPADIWTLEQGANGLLWLGTGMGLFRFDGLRFSPYPLREGQRLPSTNINALKLMPDGDIWLGFYGGGAARLHDGHVEAFSVRDGLPNGRILHFAQTGDGALWAAAGTGLARYLDGQWRIIGADWNYNDSAVDYVHVDRRGVLWVCTSRRLLYLLPGERQFRDSGLPVSRSAVVAEDLDGRLWISEGLQGTRPLPDLTTLGDHDVAAVDGKPVAASSASPAASPALAPPAPRDARRPPAFATAKQLLFARDGSVWMTVAGSGVWRLPSASAIPTGRSVGPQDQPQRFEREQGLSSPVVVPVIEDREGTVWVGSNNGLASFQRTRLHDLADLSGAPLRGFVLVPHGDGMLAANAQTALEADPPGPMREWRGPVPARDTLRAADGALWWMSNGRFIRRDAVSTREIPMPPALRDGNPLAALPDGGSGIWISVEDQGIYLATPDGVKLDPRLRELHAPQTMTLGPDGALWMAQEDEVLRWSDDTLTRWTHQDGLSIGRATAISVTERRLVVAGENGVAFFDGRRFTTLTQSVDAVYGHVTGIVESLPGDVWLNGGRGVVQVRTEDLRDFAARPGTPLSYRLFDRRDGLPGIALQAVMVPTALRDRRGRLWFATNRGVAWLDPATVPRNNQPPLTEIHALRSGEQLFRADPGLTLPAGTRHVTLSYTAITLAAADRARFRYRLEGVDPDWHEAGNAREATYANLSPGTYRFHVIAANGDGVWDTRGAMLEFHIAPTWMQTRSFAAGLVLLVLVLGWGAYRVRTRAIARQVRWRMEERLRERERIARELHDTLLQGVQGLVLQFNGVARRVKEPELNDRLERALGNAERLLLAARDRVSDLRHHFGPLSEDLTTAAAAHGDGRVTVQVDVQGMERALRPTVQDELLMIGREALSNAVRHAGASQLGVWLHYEPRRMTLRIVDDGAGMPTEFTSAEGRPGHHGIRGMFERAHRLHGSLRIRNRPEGGTEVEVRVLASEAYAPAARARRRRQWRGILVRLARPLRTLLRSRKVAR